MPSAPPTAAWTCCTVYEAADPLGLLGRRYRAGAAVAARVRMASAPTARQDAEPAPLALGHHHAARRGDGRGRGQLRRRLGLAPLVGSEFVPQTDQGFTQLALRCRWAPAWSAPTPRCAGREIVLALPEVQDRVHLGRRRRASATRPG
jgi:hypothetical protein